MEGVGITHLLPASADVDLKPGELGLVAHLLAARHPIAQVDIGQARGAGDLDMIEDDVVAQPVTGAVGGVEGIDHADPVAQHIGQANAHQIARVLIDIFNHPAADRGFLDHGGKFKHIHIRHSAIRMAAVEVTAEEVILVFGRPGRGGPAHQAFVALG